MSGRVTIRRERADQPEVEALLLAARALLGSLYPAESCHGLDLGAYQRPEVTLFVARDDGMAVGRGAFQLHGDGSAEVKGMFVAEDARGRGIGRALLDAIEAGLRGRVQLLRLETGIHQLEAIRPL